MFDPWNKKKRHKEQQKIENQEDIRQLPLTGFLSLN